MFLLCSPQCSFLLSNVKSKFQFFSWVFTVFLGIEIFYVLLEAQQMISTNGYISPGALKGVTANRNITAFSLAIKLPFVYFLLTQVNKKIYKLLLSVVSFSTFFGLLMIQSRASFLATGFGVISFIGGLLFLEIKKKEKLKFKLQPLILIVVTLTAAITINQTVLKDKGADALSRAATIGQITTDDSITARIRYYSDVLDQMISSPIFGVGLGNWKLKSIDYDKYDIKGYVVPYHAHSDFIQLGAELGVIGFFSYLSIFILLIILLDLKYF
jgi:O-antigen ligase